MVITLTAVGKYYEEINNMINACKNFIEFLPDIILLIMHVAIIVVATKNILDIIRDNH